MITSDFNFVNIDFFVEWQVSHPVKALYASHRPVEILSFLVQSGARSVVSNTDIDSVLTTGKGEIQASIREHVTTALDELDIGIRLVNVVIQDSEPPTAEVMAAFKSVENARQEKDTLVNNANRYRNEQIPNARATSDQILQGAEANKRARINEANGQVARFNEMFSEYIKNPEITRMRLFFEAMERIIPGVEVIIEGEGTVEKIYPVRPFTGEDNGGGF
jgi:membrane protease subunit HflK